jgi:hypothetical protein
MYLFTDVPAAPVARVAVTCLLFAVLAADLARAQATAANSLPGKAAMTLHASGTFEVKLAALDPYNKDDGAIVGRMSLDKRFLGDLDGAGKGEMLTAGTVSKGSAGYVAIEWVTGTLHGKRGSFALQHSGSMNRGAPQLAISVVADSGAGELTGIAGKMTIIVTGGKHSYEFDYSLPGAP